MVGLLVGVAALVGGYVVSRRFVRRKLRFVDAVQSPAAPLIAGVVAGAVFLPVTILPLVTVLTAAAFGIGVGSGVASGRKALPPGS
ncbi:MAG TPA: hypothetical protein VH163_00680 [Gemmatimonadales bacterium]|jgi:hypothetical protein|nr:hypothetical protein [Gemmatimonadales bacterium]